MAGSSAEEMLERYTRLIEHDDPLARSVDNLVKIALEKEDMLDRYTRFLQQRKPLAFKVDELIQIALAQRDVESGIVPAVTSAAGKVLADLDNGLGSLTAVDGGIDSPVDLTETSADKVAAVDKAPENADTELATDDGPGSVVDQTNAFEDFETSVNKAAGTSAAVERRIASVEELELDSSKTQRVEDTAPADRRNEHDERPIAKLQLKIAGTKAASSFGSGIHRGARNPVDSPHNSVTAHSEAVASSGPAQPIDQAMTGISHKRKSTQDHEATNKSRKTQITVPVTDTPRRGLFHTSISSTSSRQVSKQADDSSAEKKVNDLSTTRKPNAVSMTAGNESALSRLPSRLQVPVDGTTHNSTNPQTTNDKTPSATSTEDVSATVAAVAETWAGVRLVAISASTTASVFVSHLRKAMTAALVKAPLLKKKATDNESNSEDDAKDLRTEYVDVIHATMRVHNARRLRAGLYEIVESAEKNTRKHDFSILNDERQDAREGTSLTRMKALYEQYNLGGIHNDDLWFWVKKMSLACRFMSIFDEMQTTCSHSGSVAYRMCEEYLASRKLSGGEARRKSETNPQVVKSMTADLLRKPGTSKFNNYDTKAQRDAFKQKLKIFRSYQKIATTCGGPGIFCLLPEKPVAKITLCGVTFRDDFLENLAAQFPAYKELGRLLTENVLIPVILGDIEALKRLPLYNARLTSKPHMAMPTWHELLSLPAAG